MGKIGINHAEFLYKWSRYINYVELSAVLENNSYYNIAIYGGGVIGEIFFEYLCTTDITVQCIIDQNPDLNFSYDVNVLLPEQFINSEINVDAIFITCEDYIGVSSFFKSIVNCAIVPLSQFIVDVDVLYYLSKVQSHIANSNVKLYLMDITEPVYNMKNPSILEQHILIHKRVTFNYFDMNGLNTKLLYQYYNDLPNCNKEYIESVFVPALPKVIQKNGAYYLVDIENQYCNVIGGIRFTTDNPVQYDHTIYFFGDCRACGVYTEDQYTIESQLQRKLNSQPLNKKVYRVLNHSDRRPYIDCLKRILNTNFFDNDIIILLNYDMDFGLKYYLNSNMIQYSNIVSAFDRPHDQGEIFFDHNHMNHRGYKLLTNKIYDVLSKPFCSSEDQAKRGYLLKALPHKKKTVKLKIGSNDKSELSDYISFLKNEVVVQKGIIGAIVMNCNPFTNGHRYLIEQACTQCDYLYVFVVEEDKSYFSFKDRFMLVKAGTSDISNVGVLPGGKFIISSITLPGYFTKESDIYQKIDASQDLNIFVDSIAPALNITKRFVGEEPLDPVTNQYNHAMHEILPKSGITVVEIPRKNSTDGNPISASRVRKALKSADFEIISHLVPDSTLEYLKTQLIVSK
jgi:[citrate (pro-3S)-lyase] ligase